MYHFLYGFLGFLGLLYLPGLKGAVYALVNLAAFFLYQKYDREAVTWEYAEYAAGWAVGLGVAAVAG